MARLETFAAIVNPYIRRIDEARHMWQVEEIVEHSAWDDNLTKDEYWTIYGYALKRYREIEAGA